MLDTDIASHIIRGRSRRLDERLRESNPSDVCISAITRAELRYGVARVEPAPRLAAQVEFFLAGIATVAWDDGAADRYGRLRALIERCGTPIGSLDTLIAAHALAVGAKIVTLNLRHFERVPELCIEMWAL